VYLGGALTQPEKAAPAEPAAPPWRLSEAAEAWAATKDTTNIAVLEAFTGRYKNTYYAVLARERIEELKRGRVAGASPPSAGPSNQSVPVTECDQLAASPFDANAVAPGVDAGGIEHARAVPACEEAVATYPESPRLRFQLGRAYSAKGDRDRAIADYSKTIELRPTHALAYTNRGAAYEAMGNHDRAIADYSKAIDIDPMFAIAYHNRGVAYKAKGDYDHAIADYSKA